MYANITTIKTFAVYVEVFADDISDERVDNVRLSLLGFSKFKHCKTALASAKNISVLKTTR